MAFLLSSSWEDNTTYKFPTVQKRYASTGRAHGEQGDYLHSHVEPRDLLSTVWGNEAPRRHTDKAARKPAGAAAPTWGRRPGQVVRCKMLCNSSLEHLRIDESARFLALFVSLETEDA